MSEKIILDEIKNVIDQNIWETESFILYAYEGLKKFGGSFANDLGHLLGVADETNRKKILIMWIDELIEHASIFVTWAEKNRPDLLRTGYERYLIKKDSE